MSVLDNRIDYIEKVYKIKFHGTTEEEKQQFVDKYFERTRELVAECLNEACKETVGNQND